MDWRSPRNSNPDYSPERSLPAGGKCSRQSTTAAGIYQRVRGARAVGPGHRDRPWLARALTPPVLARGLLRITGIEGLTLLTSTTSKTYCMRCCESNSLSTIDAPRGESGFDR